jgi:paraquat-inducible protein B
VPPLTEADAPGARLVIEAESASSVSVGDSVLYNDYVVGRVESMEFDHKKEKISYGVFIDAPYHKLLNSSVRFWNISGFSLTASAEGVSFDTGSLETILSGGISFGVPEGMPVGSSVKNGTAFKLYSNYNDTLEKTYRYGEYYVVSFKQNLGGLVPGAPVQYRGITIGRVERILMKEMVTQGTNSMGRAIPVLIYLEPGRLALGDDIEGKNQLTSVVTKGVEHGLRATLASGNLLTGSLLVSLDYFPDEEKAKLGSFNEYQVIPSISGGLEQIQHSVAKFLKKLNSLPLEKIASSSDQAFSQLDESLTSLNTLLSSEDMKNIPIQISKATKALNTEDIPKKLASVLDSLKRTLDGLSPDSAVYEDLDNTLYELNDALQGVEELTKSLSEVSSILPSADIIDPEPEVTK